MPKTYYPPQVTMSVYGVFTVIGIILTCLRFYIRLNFSREVNQRRGLSVDDFFILFGLIVLCVCTGIQFNDAIYGLSGEATNAHDQQSRQLTQNKADFSMKAIEKIAFGAIKLSLLFFYDRIFGFWPSFKRINTVLIVIVSLWTVAFFLADLFLCGAHPSLQWQLNQKALRGKCGDTGALLIAFAATSVITDLMVLGLPLLYVRKLQLRRRKMAAATAVFLLGGISTMAGVLRLIWLSIAYTMGRLTWGYTAPANTKTPLVLQVFNPTFWVMMEMMLGVWCANLPALAPLAKAINKRLKGGSTDSKLSGTTAFTHGDSHRKESATTIAYGDTYRKASKGSEWAHDGLLQKKDSAHDVRGRGLSNATFV